MMPLISARDSRLFLSLGIPCLGAYGGAYEQVYDAADAKDEDNGREDGVVLLLLLELGFK